MKAKMDFQYSNLKYLLMILSDPTSMMEEIRMMDVAF